MIEHTFKVGRYTCTATYDGPTPITGRAGVLDVTFEWTPFAPPDPSRLTAEERRAYCSERDAFLARVMTAGVH
jgi:hypothetical protein